MTDTMTNTMTNTPTQVADGFAWVNVSVSDKSNAVRFYYPDGLTVQQIHAKMAADYDGWDYRIFPEFVIAYKPHDDDSDSDSDSDDNDDDDDVKPGEFICNLCDKKGNMEESEEHDDNIYHLDCVPHEDTIQTYVCHNCSRYTNQSDKEREKYDPLCKFCFDKFEALAENESDDE